MVAWWTDSDSERYVWSHRPSVTCVCQIVYQIGKPESARLPVDNLVSTSCHLSCSWLHSMFNVLSKTMDNLLICYLTWYVTCCILHCITGENLPCLCHGDSCSIIDIATSQRPWQPTQNICPIEQLRDQSLSSTNIQYYYNHQRPNTTYGT